MNSDYKRQAVSTV